MFWSPNEPQQQQQPQPPVEQTLPTPSERLTSLLLQVGNPANCRGCGAPIYWVNHRNGKSVPYTPEGLNHFIDCPAANQFRRK